MFILTKSSRSHAFTLLELLAGLALMVVFLALLWGILATYTKNQQRGVLLGERSQIVRSISQLLTDDLGAAIQDPVHPHKEAPGGDDSVRRFGLYGDATTLRIDMVEVNPFAPTLTREAAPRQAAMGDVGPVESRVPELKTVYYDFRGPRGGSLKSSGLARRELDFETSDFPVDEDAGATHIPEVVACMFRYSDGSAWRDDWDSIANNGLPVAIEVTLRLMPLEDVVRLKNSNLVPPEHSPGDMEPQQIGAFSLGTDEVFGDTGAMGDREAPFSALHPSGTVDIEALAASLGLAMPITQRIVVYLPTSPVRKYEEYQRRKPDQKPDNAPPPIQPPTIVQQDVVQQSVQQQSVQQQSVQQQAVEPPPPTTPPEVPPPPKEPTPQAPAQQWIRSSGRGG